MRESLAKTIDNNSEAMTRFRGEVERGEGGEGARGRMLHNCSTTNRKRVKLESLPLSRIEIILYGIF